MMSTAKFSCNSSQLSGGCLSSDKSPKRLIVTRTFLPSPGGIEDYVYSLCEKAPQPLAVLSATCQDDSAFDEHQPFPIHRWPVLPFPKVKVLTGLVKQIIYLFWELVASLRLYKTYHYSEIEWCHGYDFPVLLILSYLLPIKCVMHLHGNDLLCPLKNPVLRPLFSFTLNRMEHIVCNSTFTRQYLEENFTVKVPIKIMNPVVRPEKFGPTPTPSSISGIRATHNISDDALVLLSVGRLVPRKGFDTVIKLLPKILETGLDVHYVICGKGKQQSELKSLVARLDLSDRVHFAGYVPDDQLASYYMACDVFTLPTFFNAAAKSIEGFGIVYVEAGYFGKPVVACDVGGVIDAVKHEQNGLLVSPDKPDEVLDAILRLCNNPDLREQLGEYGKQLAISNLPTKPAEVQEAS